MSPCENLPTCGEAVALSRLDPDSIFDAFDCSYEDEGEGVDCA